MNMAAYKGHFLHLNSQNLDIETGKPLLPLSYLQTDAVLLALSLGVGVVTSKYEAVAGEGGLRHRGHDGVVHPRLPWDGVLQPVDGIVSLVLHG